jgi:hypothetical protein
VKVPPLKGVMRHCWRRLAPPSALHWCLLPCFAGVIVLGAPASVQSQRRSGHVLVRSIVVKSVPQQQRRKLGVAGLVIPVVIFVPVNVLVYVQSLERSSWAPPAYLHYWDRLTQESDEAIEAGWRCNPPVSLWANAAPPALVAPPGKNQQHLRHILVRPGGFCQ